MNPDFESFRKKMTDPIRFRFFMLLQLPAAYFAGLWIASMDASQASISVPFKWFTKNPFRSIYFAVLSMAAEMSTGILAFGQVYQRSVSMLVVGMEAKFYKKAVGRIRFDCADGLKIAAAVEQAIQNGQGETVECLSVGKNEHGEVVAEFRFVWSFKKKN